MFLALERGMGKMRKKLPVGLENHFLDRKESAGARGHFFRDFGNDGGVYGE